MTVLEGTTREEMLAPLLADGWSLSKEGDALLRAFKFRNFVEAFGWMTRMAMVSEKMNHHPDWSNSYNRVEVSLSTHDAGGLTELDVRLATRMSKAFAG